MSGVQAGRRAWAMVTKLATRASAAFAGQKVATERLLTHVDGGSVGHEGCNAWETDAMMPCCVDRVYG